MSYEGPLFCKPFIRNPSLYVASQVGVSTRMWCPGQLWSVDAVSQSTPYTRFETPKRLFEKTPGDEIGAFLNMRAVVFILYFTSHNFTHYFT